MPKQHDVVCLKCHKDFTASMDSNFFGYRKYTCSHCGNVNTYPLRPLYRFFYGVAIFFFVVVLLAMLTGDSGVPLPGLLAVVGVPTLIYDRMLAKSVKSATTAEA